MLRGTLTVLAVLALGVLALPASAPAQDDDSDEPEVTSEDVKQYFKEEVLDELQQEVERESWIFRPQYREPTNRDKEEYLRAVGKLLFHAAVYRDFYIEDKGYPADPKVLVEEGLVDEWPTNPYTEQPMQLAGWRWFAPGDLFWAYYNVPCESERYCGKYFLWTAVIGRKRSSQEYWKEQFPEEDFKFNSALQIWPQDKAEEAPGYYIFLRDSTPGTLNEDARYSEIWQELQEQAEEEQDSETAQKLDRAESTKVASLDGLKFTWERLEGGAVAGKGSFTLSGQALEVVELGYGDELVRIYAQALPTPEDLELNDDYFLDPEARHYTGVFEDAGLKIVVEQYQAGESWRFTVDGETVTDSEGFVPGDTETTG